MTDHNNHDEAMGVALGALSDGPLYVAGELRLMARAEEPYKGFSCFSPEVKNIWLAAAEIIEKNI